MAAQRQHTAAWTSDVAQQELQDRHGSNDLHADRMLRQPDGVADRRGPIRTRAERVAIGDLEERFAWHAADALDHLRRVASEMPLDLLIDAARVQHRRIAPGFAAAIEIVLPRRKVVRLALLTPSREESVQ